MPDYRKLKLLRRIKVMRGRRGSWRDRAVFWLGALAIGFVSVGFAVASDWALEIFRFATTSSQYAFLYPLVITPVGFMVSAWVAFVYFPNSQGSGIPQAIAARHFKTKEYRARLLSLKLGFGKILLTVFGLMCGASIGREGPTVQVGAALMLQSARIGRVLHAKGLILAGSAAGIAAAFNTPLAGIVFAIEEMSRNFQIRANGAILTAVILAGLASLALIGNYTYFGETTDIIGGVNEWMLVPICGIGGGILGAIFSSGTLWLAIRIKRWCLVDTRKRIVYVAGVSGLLVAVTGIVSGGTTFGSGYEMAHQALEGEALPPLFFIEKMFATFVSMMSGIPGGIFAPSLSVGAGLGSTAGMLLGTSIGIAALLGMAGYFSGVVQAPMTAFVIILEMTGSHDNVIALMATAMLGYVSARMISPEPLYHGLSRAFIADTIRVMRAHSQAAAQAEREARDEEDGETKPVDRSMQQQ